jgi:hypothetical protein
MRTIVLVLCLVVSGTVFAQELIVFPAKGQSEQQLEKDKFECYSWAKKQTGVDPMQLATATSPPPAKEAPRGGVGRGAARGAAVGAAVGSIDGEMGEGAKKGAAAGAVVGGVRRRSQRRGEEQEQKQYEADQSAAQSARTSEYNRAYGACLEGKGYTVK